MPIVRIQLNFRVKIVSQSVEVRLAHFISKWRIQFY